MSNSMQSFMYNSNELSFKKYIFSYRFHLINFFLCIPLIILIVIIYPFYKIRIGELRSRAIGEFASPAEIYLSEIKLEIIKKRKNETHLFFFNHEISNSYLANHWKKQLIILPRIILEPIYFFCFSNAFFKKFLVPWRYNTHTVKKIYVKPFFPHTCDVNDVLKKFEPSMKFNVDEVINGENNLKKFGYNPKQKIVCFANRDGAFKKEQTKSKRNADIKTYKSAIEYLADKDIFNIRMGRLNQDKITFYQKNIFDYSFSNLKSNFMDMFIFSKCSFLISTVHGITDLATFFRKKKLVINFEMHDRFHYLSENYTPLVLPKKYINLKNNEFVHFRQIYEKRLCFMSFNDLENFGYKLIDNTEDEILDATKEMYNLSNNNYKIDLSKQNKFWDMHESYFKWKPKLMMISSSFFEKNKDIFL